jgi:hypothetical protein
MRHPVFVALRSDREPRDIERERASSRDDVA